MKIGSISGSLTQLIGGTSYLVAGPGISITSASNGSVTITNDGTVGDITAVTAGTGLTGGGSSGAVTLNINDSVVATISGSTFTGDIGVNGGDITTTAATATLFNTNATNLTIGGAATTLTLGAGPTSTTTIRGGTIIGDVLSQNVFNTVATTVNAFGAATTLALGNTATGNQTVNLGTASTGQSTYNIATGATQTSLTKTVNIGTGGDVLSVTNVNIGSANGGTVTLSNNATVSNDLAVNGGDVTTTAATATLFNTNATNLSVGGAATTLALGNTVTAAQTLNLGTASTGASTYNIGTGATANATTKTLNIGTGGAAGSTTNINIGSTNGDGTVTINENTTITGDLAVNGGDVTTTQATATLFNTNATNLTVGGAATALTLGATPTATTTVRGGTLVGDATAQNVFNTTATTVNAFGAATTLAIGNTATVAQTLNLGTASTGSSTYNIGTGATASGTTKTLNLGTGGAAGSTTNINLGSENSAGTLTIKEDTTITGSLQVKPPAAAQIFNLSNDLCTIGNNTTSFSFQVTGSTRFVGVSNLFQNGAKLSSSIYMHQTSPISTTSHPVTFFVNNGAGLDDRWGQGINSLGSLEFFYGFNTTTLSTRGYLDKNVNVLAIDFTGQHRSIPTGAYEEYAGKIGQIVIANGSYSPVSGSTISISDAIPNVELSSTRNDKRCFGVIADTEDTESNSRTYNQGIFVSVYEKSSPQDNRLYINSLGEGCVWVCNINGNLENGDYITTCEIPGMGMKQNDDLLHNYTVAKITMDCNFDLNSTTYTCEEFVHDGVTYKRAFVGCTYHCG